MARPTPVPTGGTVVQVRMTLGDPRMAELPGVYAPVQAGAAEAHYTQEEDILFGVIDPEHVLMPAVESGRDRGLPETRLALTLRRGLYEVWSARMRFRTGATGIYYQLRHQRRRAVGTGAW
jgi:hypothetical protein